LEEDPAQPLHRQDSAVQMADPGRAPVVLGRTLNNNLTFESRPSGGFGGKRNSAGLASKRAREAEWELGTFATDKYRSSLTTSRKSLSA
jgi:hypothetical protein